MSIARRRRKLFQTQRYAEQCLLITRGNGLIWSWARRAKYFYTGDRLRPYGWLPRKRRPWEQPPHDDFWLQSADPETLAYLQNRGLELARKGNS